MNGIFIPDVSDDFKMKSDPEQFNHLPNDPAPYKKPYWLSILFKVPVADNCRLFQLIFKDINYLAAV
jgi:hypothetical protein